MKVLLINPNIPASATAGRYRGLLAPMPPISLAYVAAGLQSEGIETAVHDDAALNGDTQSTLDAVRTARPDVVGLSCVTITANRTFEIARAVRAEFPSIHITMGNIHPSVYHETVLREGLADTVVVGEGEKTFPELVKALESGRPLGEVDGVAWLNGDKPTLNPDRAFIHDLDALPFPAWDLFPLNHYKIFSFAVVRNPGTLVLGSRGCPFRCTFCSLKIMGTTRRHRSAANIADEFEWLHDKFGYKQMSFTDPIFPFSKKEGVKFATELISRGLHKKAVWITETRVDLVDYDLLASLRASGMRRVMFGFESGDAAGIKGIKKHFTTDQARVAVDAARKAGVEVVGFFMLGIPGETKKSMVSTLKYSRSLGINFAKFTIFSPFPGTKSHQDLLEAGKIPDSENWERYTNYPSPDVEAVYIPDGLTNADLIRAQRSALIGFYLRPLMILRHLFVIRSLRLSDMFRGLAAVMRR